MLETSSFFKLFIFRWIKRQGTKSLSGLGQIFFHGESKCLFSAALVREDFHKLQCVSSSFLMPEAGEFAHSPRLKRQSALERLVFESNEAWFLCKASKGEIKFVQEVFKCDWFYTDYWTLFFWCLDLSGVLSQLWGVVCIVGQRSSQSYLATECVISRKGCNVLQTRGAVNKLFRYATISRLGSAKQPVCCNPATLYYSKKRGKKILARSWRTYIPQMPFDWQSVVEFLDGPPWSVKHNKLEMAEMVAKTGHDGSAKLVSDDRSFVLCWPLGSFNARTWGHSVGLNLHENSVLQ